MSYNFRYKTSAMESNLLVQYLKIAAVVAGYWTVSILTVFINKALFSSELINLEAPIFITWYQCVLSAVLCFVLSNTSKRCPKLVNFPSGTPLDVNNVRQVVPLAVLFICTIVSNNLCLKYVDVAFYYIGRSLTTVFNVVLSYVLLGQTTSFRVVVCCSLIVSGFWLGVDQESIAGSLSLLGTMFGVLGSLALPLYSIHTKKVLPAVNQEVLLLSYYNNVYSSVLLIPLIIIGGEVPVILSYDKLFDPYFWLMMNIGGLCGFAIGFFTGLQIKVTSPLTHNISGTAKACFQTLVATRWYGDYKSYLWWASNWVVLMGSFAYTYVRHCEMKQQHAYSRLAQSKSVP